MTPRPAPPEGGPPPARRRRRAARPTPGTVVDLVQTRIVRALDQRQRYTYVQPRVIARSDACTYARTDAQGQPTPARGWCIVSPNCSRNIDTRGGEIPIAWFEPDAQGDGRWHLHAFAHGQQQWQCQARGLTLADALALVLDDPERQYWP